MRKKEKNTKMISVMNLNNFLFKKCNLNTINLELHKPSIIHSLQRKSPVIEKSIIYHYTYIAGLADSWKLSDIDPKFSRNFSGSGFDIRTQNLRISGLFRIWISGSVNLAI